jgi:hypothetical protein
LILASLNQSSVPAVSHPIIPPHRDPFSVIYTATDRDPLNDLRMSERVQSQLARMEGTIRCRLRVIEEKLSFLPNSSAEFLSHRFTTPEGFPALPSTSTSGEFSIDEFAANYPSDPEPSIQALIAAITEGLQNTVSTKRFVEKANCQYVDSLFQRASTHLTAQVNQRVLARHHQVESELAAVDAEVDSLTDYIAHELAEMRAIIQDCRSLMAQIKAAKDEAMLRLSDQQRCRLSMKKGPPKKTQVSLLRERKNVQADSVEISLALRISKPV